MFLITHLTEEKYKLHYIGWIWSYIQAVHTAKTLLFQIVIITGRYKDVESQTGNGLIVQHIIYLDDILKF